MGTLILPESLRNLQRSTTMKFVKGIVLAGTLGLAVATAGSSSYTIQLSEKAVVAGKELKPGEYKVQVDGDKATIKNSNQTAEATVKVETSDQKFSRSTVRYNNADGKYRVEQIQLGGTKTTLVFGNDSG